MHVLQIPRIVAVALVATLLGCPAPKPPDRVDKPPGDGVNVEEVTPTPDLPNVPSILKTAQIQPYADHDMSAKSPLIAHMAEENARWMKKLRTHPKFPAYYIAYQIHGLRIINIDAEGGALIDNKEVSDRFLDVEVRVGKADLDNRRPLSKNSAANRPRERIVYAPHGADRQATQSALWLETDRRYREAAMQLAYVMQDQLVSASKHNNPDFVHEKKEIFFQRPAKLEIDRKNWGARMMKCSKSAMRGFATRGTCSARFELHTMYFVNSEGTQLQTSWTTAQISISVGVKAKDSDSLSRSEQAHARTPSGLPNDAELEKIIKRVTSDLDALHEAKRVDPYVGPAILQGRAAGVFFHEVFGHRIEGHRQKERTSGRTFSSKVGKSIMPAWLSVYDDPTLDSINSLPLNGFYRFDDEGVRARRATLVHNGVLKGFVMGRNPIPGFSNSNGHGRKQLGNTSVSRQGNLVVETSRSVPDDELVKMLIAEVKKQKKPFGMIFTDIKGGFTLTQTDLPQAFKVEPTLAYRVYPDGRKELVRGVDIVGTPLTVLGAIIAAGRTVETFNGMCGAESGWVPVSASAPSLLIQRLETERKAAPNQDEPVLDPPGIRQIQPQEGAR